MKPWLGERALVLPPAIVLITNPLPALLLMGKCFSWKFHHHHHHKQWSRAENKVGTVVGAKPKSSPPLPLFRFPPHSTYLKQARFTFLFRGTSRPILYNDHVKSRSWTLGCLSGWVLPGCCMARLRCTESKSCTVAMAAGALGTSGEQQAPSEAGGEEAPLGVGGRGERGGSAWLGRESLSPIGLSMRYRHCALVCNCLRMFRNTWVLLLGVWASLRCI